MTRLARFDDHPKHYRMLQAWLILTALAAKKDTITYGDLSEHMFGRRLPRSKDMKLGQLWAYCHDRGLPLLPVLVVLAGSAKRPAEAAPYEPSEVTQLQAEVYAYAWHQLLPPSEAELLAYNSR